MEDVEIRAVLGLLIEAGIAGTASELTGQTACALLYASVVAIFQLCHDRDVDSFAGFDETNI